MPLVTRVLETALYCADLEACAVFFERLFQADRLVEGERLVALDAGGGTVLLLFGQGRSSHPIEIPGGRIPGHDGRGPVHVAFAINGDAVNGWERRLAEHGIALESRVEWPRGGTSLYFRDPEGRSIELATPGTWATY